MFARLRDFAARLFRRKPPEPGSFVAGAKFAFSGFLRTLPWIWPRREYLLYVPAGWSWWRRAPLVVLCHGCRQTPEEFAAGNAHRGAGGCARLARALAAAEGFGECVALLELVRWRYRRRRRRGGDRRGDDPLGAAPLSGRSASRRRRRNVGGRRARRGARRAASGRRSCRRDPLGPCLRRREVGVHRDRRDAARPRSRRRGHRRRGRACGARPTCPFLCSRSRAGAIPSSPASTR